jgi:uncharacterized protein YggE
MKKILLPVVLFFLMQNLLAQNTTNPFPKTITVTGSAEMEIIPDEIYVNVELREYQKKGESKKDLETIKTQFLQTCKNIGLPDSSISIASYSGFNNYYWWKKNKKKNPDLFATITYQIKFRNSGMMDNLIDKLDDEATQNFAIVSLSHSKMTEFRKQLKIQAVKAAREKGIYLTEAIGEKLGSAITITEPAEFQPYPLQGRVSGLVANAMYEMKSENGDKVQEVDFKKLKLKYDVTIVFALQ